MAWKKFYRNEFNNLQDFWIFVKKCLGTKDNRPNLILNIGKRFIDFADNSKKLAKNCGGFQIFFLVVCAESITRILEGTPYERQISQKSVVKFCEDNFCDVDKKFFEETFSVLLSKNKCREKLSLKEIIDFFYRVRCAVAHNGVYQSFHWANNHAVETNFIQYCDNKKKTIIKDSLVIKAGVNYEKIRTIFICAVINAVKKIIP
jgi:hypothetical protein